MMKIPARVFNLFTGLLLLNSSLIYGQKPIINYVDRMKGKVDETIIISGAGFNTDATKLAVFFGASQGQIVKSSENTLEVKVPPGATYENVNVINLASGLSGTAPKKFMLSYGGNNFDPDLVSAPYEFKSGGTQINSFCTGDFNNDGKNDFITTHPGDYSLTIFENISSYSEASNSFSVGLIKSSYPINIPTKYITTNDLNGDGRLDLVVVPEVNSDQLFVIKNTSSNGVLSFDLNQVKLQIPTISAGDVYLEDIDNDGKKDVMVCDPQDKASYVHIFRNTSSSGNLTFESKPITVSLGINDPDITYGPQNIKAKDLNNDGYPEVVVSYHFKKYLVVLPNRSIPGKIGFGKERIFDLKLTNLENINIGDINGDNLPDLIITNYGLTPDLFNIFILINNYPDETKPFQDPIKIDISNRAWEVALGDVNGDGAIDMVFPATYDYASDEFGVLINTTQNGIVSFTEHMIPAAYKNQFAAITDVNGDGKPDFVLADKANKLEILLNNNCVVPAIGGSNKLSICDGTTIALQATKTRYVNYSWKKDNVEVGTGSSSLNVNATGSYTVTMSSYDNSCATTSAAVNVTVDPGPALLSPSPVNNGPACIGDDINLTVTLDTNAAGYKWTGPNGFTSTDPNPVLNSFSNNMVGKYIIEVVNTSGCISLFDTTLVELKHLPQVNIAGSTALCAGEEVTLQAAEFNGYNLNYQWKKDGTNISAATNSAYTVTGTGNYSVRYSEGLCSGESNTFKVQSIPLPTASFEATDIICKDKNIQFSNTSSVNSTLSPTFSWTFGDGTSSAQDNPVKKYQSPGVFTVDLMVKYANTNCSDTFEKSIEIKAPPLIEITSSPGSQLCPGDSILLEANKGFSSYLWSNNKTISGIYVKEPGTYLVQVFTAEQCESISSIDITEFSVDSIMVNTLEGDSIIRIGQSIQLFAETEYRDFNWSPGESLDDSTIIDPLASPEANTNYVVSGKDVNGCIAFGEFYLQVDGGIGEGLSAMKLFSPNGDGQNNEWIIDDLDSYPNHELVIFNREGFKVYEASPYQNNWNGMLEGKQLPEGVYYYVLKFKDTGESQTGNILMVR